MKRSSKSKAVLRGLHGDVQLYHGCDQDGHGDVLGRVGGFLVMSSIIMAVMGMGLVMYSKDMVVQRSTWFCSVV